MSRLFKIYLRSFGENLKDRENLKDCRRAKYLKSEYAQLLLLDGLKF